MNVKNELKELVILEGFSGISFLILYVIWIRKFHISFSMVAFYPILCCSIILIQGSVFWGITLWRINERALDMASVANIYRLFRIIDGGILIAYIVVLLGAEVTEKRLIFGIAVYIFSILEYINYYYVRLSYPLPEFMRRLVKVNFSKSRIARLLEHSARFRR